MVVCITVLTLNPQDFRYIPLLSNEFIINKLVVKFFKINKDSLPGYCTRYDANSIWLVKQPNRKPTDPIWIYIHGGGYFLQTLIPQPASLVTVYKLLDKDVQSKLSILYIDYKLTSHGYKMPYQMAQLHETYTKLVLEGNKTMYLGGDSAGGNLSIGYTQYLTKVAGATLPPPKTLVLISPWLDLNPGPEAWKPGRSYYDNDKYDMIKYKTFNGEPLKVFFDCDISDIMYSPGSEPIRKEDWEIDCYSSPDHNVFVVCGEDETFRDEVLKWCETVLDMPCYTGIKYGYSTGKFDPLIHHYRHDADVNHCRSELFIEPWGVHDSCMLLESKILRSINEIEATGGKVSFRDLSDDQFGLSRIAGFLNDVIE